MSDEWPTKAVMDRLQRDADTIEALRAENARLRKELRDADEMLLGQARTIRDYQDKVAEND